MLRNNREDRIMANNEIKKSETKEIYESPVIEFITLDCNDVLTSSGFSGDDDPILPPDKF